jgi:hypothetical protein
MSIRQEKPAQPAPATHPTRKEPRENVQPSLLRAATPELSGASHLHLGQARRMVTGEGPHAVLAWCRVQTVTLHDTEEATLKSKAMIDDTAAAVCAIDTTRSSSSNADPPCQVPPPA